MRFLLTNYIKLFIFIFFYFIIRILSNFFLWFYYHTYYKWNFLYYRIFIDYSKILHPMNPIRSFKTFIFFYSNPLLCFTIEVSTLFLQLFDVILIFIEILSWIIWFIIRWTPTWIYVLIIGINHFFLNRLIPVFLKIFLKKFIFYYYPFKKLIYFNFLYFLFYSFFLNHFKHFKIFNPSKVFCLYPNKFYYNYFLILAIKLKNFSHLITQFTVGKILHPYKSSFICFEYLTKLHCLFYFFINKKIKYSNYLVSGLIDIRYYLHLSILADRYSIKYTKYIHYYKQNYCKTFLKNIFELDSFFFKNYYTLLVYPIKPPIKLYLNIFYNFRFRELNYGQDRHHYRGYNSRRYDYIYQTLNYVSWYTSFCRNWWFDLNYEFLFVHDILGGKLALNFINIKKKNCLLLKLNHNYTIAYKSDFNLLKSIFIHNITTHLSYRIPWTSLFTYQRPFFNKFYYNFPFNHDFGRDYFIILYGLQHYIINYKVDHFSPVNFNIQLNHHKLFKLNKNIYALTSYGIVTRSSSFKLIFRHLFSFK